MTDREKIQAHIEELVAALGVLADTRSALTHKLDGVREALHLLGPEPLSQHCHVCHECGEYEEDCACPTAIFTRRVYFVGSRTDPEWTSSMCEKRSVAEEILDRLQDDEGSLFLVERLEREVSDE